MKDSKPDVARCDLAVDALLPFERMQTQILSVCKSLISKWSDSDESEFDVYRINGGITNIMTRVSRGDYAVVVRVFGTATEGVVDREREIQANCYLSKVGFCPELKGVFKNGIVQTCVTARTLGPEDLRDCTVVARIARELRRLHDQDVPGEKKPMVWSELSKYIELASAVTFSNPEDRRRLETVSFEELRREADTLKEIGALFGGAIVYAHNDLLPANIMVDDHGKYYLIDLEYSGYNYRGFDIGNHFNEYTGFDCDITAFPDKQKQLMFLRHYLHPESPDMATMEELESLYIEANFYALTAHLQWAAWTIVQATSSSTMEFDYMSYFFKRMDLYKKQKENVLPLVIKFLA